MHGSDFHVKHDTWPLVSITDELIIVHRDALAVAPVIYIGAHKDSVVEVRSAADRAAVETASAWATLTIPAGGKTKIDLPGTGNVLHLVTKIIATKGAIFVSIASPVFFDAYFKQYSVPIG